MLVLERNLDETITIGPDIEVTVVGFRHGRARLGITAPRNIPVHRKEIGNVAMRRAGTDELREAMKLIGLVEETANLAPGAAGRLARIGLQLLEAIDAIGK
jgi:carbon storage regulator